MDTTRDRVLSGMRPTGKLHLGNYMGALKNWVALQHQTSDDGTRKYECFFFIADYHALTTDYADSRNVAQNTLEKKVLLPSIGITFTRMMAVRSSNAAESHLASDRADSGCRKSRQR